MLRAQAGLGVEDGAEFDSFDHVSYCSRTFRALRGDTAASLVQQGVGLYACLIHIEECNEAGLGPVAEYAACTAMVWRIVASRAAERHGSLEGVEMLNMLDGHAATVDSNCTQYAHIRLPRALILARTLNSYAPGHPPLLRVYHDRYTLSQTSNGYGQVSDQFGERGGVAESVQGSSRESTASHNLTEYGRLALG